MNTKKPILSVITASYNNAASLLCTMKSIAQIKDFPIEHIIIDNCSTDYTKTLVTNFKLDNCDSEIIFLQEKDTGIYNAFNKGLQIARGEFISYLGCGDTYYSSSFNLLKTEFTQPSTADIYYGIVEILDSHKKRWFSYSPEYLTEGQMMHHAASFVKKDAYISINGFDEQYKSAADLDAFIKLYKKNFLFHFIPVIFTSFQAGGISTTSNISYYEKVAIMYKYGFYPKIKYFIHLLKKKIKGIKRWGKK